MFGVTCYAIAVHAIAVHARSLKIFSSGCQPWGVASQAETAAAVSRMEEMSESAGDHLSHVPAAHHRPGESLACAKKTELNVTR